MRDETIKGVATTASVLVIGFLTVLCIGVIADIAYCLGPDEIVLNELGEEMPIPHYGQPGVDYTAI